MRFQTPKLHNKILSSPLSAHADSPGATPRQPAGTAQEAVGPSPGPHPAPDARGLIPRMVPRGPASSEAILTDADACDNLSQKKPRIPAPTKGRGRRGRPDPQNRDGSGNSGLAEGSLPRLAPDGQDIEQEIALLRSLINRLLSRRPLNHTYISRYMRLLIQAQSAKARLPRQLTDEEEVDSLIKKVFHKKVEDGHVRFYNLLPVRNARPGDKWWPWRNLVSVKERQRDDLIGPDDRLPPAMEKYLDELAANEARLAEMEAMESSIADGWFEPDPDEDDPYSNNLYTDPNPDDDEYWPDPAAENEQWPGSDDDETPVLYDPPHNDTPDYEHTPDPPVVPAEAEPAPREGGRTHPHTLTEACLDPYTQCYSDAPRGIRGGESPPPDAIEDTESPPSPRRIARGRPP